MNKQAESISSTQRENQTIRFRKFKCKAWGFVFAYLLVDSHQVLMVTVAAALRVIGNEIKVYLLEDGPVRDVWKNIGVPAIIGEANNDTKIINDWLNYDAILLNSFEAKEIKLEYPYVYPYVISA
ncbi:hypothetical protein L1987_45201 [Smallanthus sonchifolius]|uniref:Uncharacterized protein n=1 Tax=Smallanthus sonchifolius TaxID=185202 RepID=A0ACB9GRD7_9ASTR|nr:hypothetical protein L1987_45201 [Smallanthus sonchifolius]